MAKSTSVLPSNRRLGEVQTRFVPIRSSIERTCAYSTKPNGVAAVMARKPADVCLQIYVVLSDRGRAAKRACTGASPYTGQTRKLTLTAVVFPLPLESGPGAALLFLYLSVALIDKWRSVSELFVVIAASGRTRGRGSVPSREAIDAKTRRVSI
jgi:hypothetical protein